MSETENMDERMKAFTPGPWLFAPTHGNMRDGYSQPFAICEDNSQNLVAGVFGDVRGGHEVAEANARLIAAAPDLLAFVAAIAGRGLTGDAYGTGREEDELTLNARTLLLKATGTP